MEKKILEYIQRYGLIRKGDCVIAGVSGGADSVCLLFVLSGLKEQIGFALEAVHVEHGIRGEESLRDAAFVKELCKELEIPLWTYACDVPSAAKAKKLTIEEAARICRYEAFEKARGMREHVRIAVAHHRDDQAETILWNLARGAGLRGLCGMRPINGRLIRPLLAVSREEIEAYLKERGISFRLDSTNLSDAYTRNRIRHQILPAMEEGMNGQARAHIAEAGERLQRAQAYLEKLAGEKLKTMCEYGKETARIHALAFAGEDEVMQEYMLRACLEALHIGMKDIGAAHVQALKKLARSQSGRSIPFPGGAAAWRSGEYLKIGKPALCDHRNEEKDLLTPGETVWGRYRIRTSIEPYKKQIIPQKKYTKWLDYDTIKNTIQLRVRKSGDYFSVENGHKKLKKYFIDEKIPKEDREDILLLADKSHILWMVGYRISESCKVTEHTKRILKVQVTEDGEDGRQDSGNAAGRDGE